MTRRSLDFRTLDDAIADVERLHEGGYERLGNWDLAQMCDHLTYFARGPLEGFEFHVPWLVQFLLGRLLFRRILSKRQMKSGVPTPQKNLPPSGTNEAAAIARFREVMQRLRDHTGPVVASPFFGPMTADQARELNCIHCAHHLAHLQPKSA